MGDRAEVDLGPGGTHATPALPLAMAVTMARRMSPRAMIPTSRPTSTTGPGHIVVVHEGGHHLDRVVGTTGHGSADIASPTSTATDCSNSCSKRFLLPGISMSPPRMLITVG